MIAQKKLNTKTITLSLLSLLSIFILKDLLISLALSAIIAYAINPLYGKIQRKLKKKTISALLTVFLVSISFIVPIISLIVTFPTRSATQIIVSIQEIIQTLSLQTGNSLIVNNYVSQGLVRILENVLNSVYQLLLLTPNILFHIFLLLIFTYYFLRYGQKLVYEITTTIKFEQSVKLKIIKKVREITDASVYGFLIIPLIQGTSALTGFIVLGIPEAIFLGILTVLTAIIPVIGSYVIWGPIAIYYIIQGVIESNTVYIVKGALLFVYGLIVISHLDNIIRSRIISRRTNINPGIIMAGIIGGITSIGLAGILLGPIILSITLALYQILRKR